MTFLSEQPASTDSAPDVSDYDLYHDESLEGGYWHGMLLVPRAARVQLLTQLRRIRDNTGYSHPIALKGIDKVTGPRFRSAEAWLSLAGTALAQRSKGSGLHFLTGRRDPHPETDSLSSVMGAKFILFRVRDGHKVLTGYADHAAKVETTFRMGLKGGLHLFAEDHRLLRVASLHFDGYEHYQRRVDGNRIVGRMGKLRDEVAFADDLLIDDRSGNHMKADSQENDDCQLLQLSDLLVSGFRTVQGESKNDAQRRAAFPLKELADRWHAGAARMRNSRWYRGFCISECFIEDDGFRFSDLSASPEGRQAELFKV